MNQTMPSRKPEEEFIFRVLVIGTVLFCLAFTWPLLLVAKQNNIINQLKRKVEKLENGVTVVNVQDIKTGKMFRYIPIDIGSINGDEIKTEHSIIIYVREDNYVAWVEDLRRRIIKYAYPDKERLTATATQNTKKEDEVHA